MGNRPVKMPYRRVDQGVILPVIDDSIGLCLSCRWMRAVMSRRGSTFYRCGRAGARDRVLGAELVGGAPGVGHSIAIAEVNGDIPQMYAFVVVSATLGVLLNVALLRLEGRALAWHPSHRPHVAA